MSHIQTLTLRVSQLEEYQLLLALIRKFSTIEVLELKETPVSAPVRDMAKYWNCLTPSQSKQAIDAQLQQIRDEWERAI